MKQLALKERIEKIYQGLFNGKSNQRETKPLGIWNAGSVGGAHKRGRKGKKIGMYDRRGRLVKVWGSLKEAHECGHRSGPVCSCCHNMYTKKKNVYHGFVWKYMEDEN